MTQYKIIKNKYDYFEVEHKPTEDELAIYYSEKYYQDGKGSYDDKGRYTKEEIKYFLNRVEQKYCAAISQSQELKLSKGRFLDVGAGEGEGWALKYFDAIGWNIKGLDFSDFGISSCNPEFKDVLVTGDIYQNLNILCNECDKFEIILLDNVLEHVREPFELLKRLKNILADNGILIIEVPNDYSSLQKKLYSEKLVSRKYWEALPDHLSYFNKKGLEALAKDAGWNVGMVFTGYPIDVNLLNENTNYIENSLLGKSCHFARIELENMIHEVSPEKVVRMYEAMADLGLGREIIALLLKETGK